MSLDILDMFGYIFGISLGISFIQTHCIILTLIWMAKISSILLILLVELHSFVGGRKLLIDCGRIWMTAYDCSFEILSLSFFFSFFNWW